MNDDQFIKNGFVAYNVMTILCQKTCNIQTLVRAYTYGNLSHQSSEIGLKISSKWKSKIQNQPKAVLFMD